MKLLLSNLLLASLYAISSCSVSSTARLVVTQSQNLSVTEGETVNITCCCTGASERMRFNWLKNETHIKNNTISSSEFQKEKSPYCSTLTFSNIRREDSGNYICKVSLEIPVWDSGEGNGTFIRVKTRENTGDNTAGDGLPGHPTPTPMIIAVVVLLPLITLACFCVLRRRRAQAARVIYEVPHIDSEEADKRSTGSSRGSSQWCQVPVYESFDYFERVQTKESG
ncbi:uncharacterized protein LOC120797031 isoform X1 [Xiphias gladius]|uniref:uncharacterized protein LOC120797031 isoform X1 n=1 Tax=Xiphias gladius TaxID=8245 RepID=UPI001A9905ED|nr:uncharacterized protein LOC120797031 isoform X1 [Xiphias gladius]